MSVHRKIGLRGFRRAARKADTQPEPDLRWYNLSGEVKADQAESSDIPDFEADRGPCSSELLSILLERV
jgi:hypothetical protein